MAEISREEAINQIGEWYGGFEEKPSEDSIHKAISDMHKMEKIEQTLKDCDDGKFDKFYCLCQIEQIVKERKNEYII